MTCEVICIYNQNDMHINNINTYIFIISLSFISYLITETDNASTSISECTAKYNKVLHILQINLLHTEHVKIYCDLFLRSIGSCII